MNFNLGGLQKVMLLDVDAPLTGEDIKAVIELLKSGQSVAILRVRPDEITPSKAEGEG